MAGALAPGHALVDGAMVGVGVVDGNGGGGGPGHAEPYPSYGEFYSDQYYVPDMCSHPQQHPQHAHVCTLPPEYGEIFILKYYSRLGAPHYYFTVYRLNTVFFRVVYTILMVGDGGFH